MFTWVPVVIVTEMKLDNTLIRKKEFYMSSSDYGNWNDTVQYTNQKERILHEFQW
jgi:hypothetical protein